MAPLFFYFLKIGSVLYGSGYVLLAFLQAELVGRWHWLTATQLWTPRGRQVNPRPGIHHGDVHRLPAGFRVGRIAGGLLGGLWRP